MMARERRKPERGRPVGGEKRLPKRAWLVHSFGS